MSKLDAGIQSVTKIIVYGVKRAFMQSVIGCIIWGGKM